VAASTDEALARQVAGPELAAPSANPWLRRIAVVLAVVAMLEALGILLLGARGDPRFPLELGLFTIGFFGTIVSFAVVGALIVVRRPQTSLAWGMIAMGTLFGATLLAGAYSALYVTPAGGNAGPFAMELLLLSGLLFVPTLGVGTTILLLLYPTDSLLSPRWKIVAAAAVVGSVLWDVGVLFRPGIIDQPSLNNVRNPLGAPAELTPLFALLPAVANLFLLPAILLAAGSLLLRYRRGDSIVRAQIRWFGLIAVVVVVSLLLASAFEPNGEVFFGVGVTAIACLPIAIGVAITRYRLYDIDLLINRAIVYGSLTAILAGLFTAGVGLGQRLFVAFTGQSSDAAIVLATLVIATLYAPLRKQLEKVIDRRFKYETRFGPYSEEVRSVLEVIHPAHAAERLAKEAVSQLDATGAAVVDALGAVLGSAGTWPLPGNATATRVELADEGPIRAILVAPGRGGRAHAAADLAALEEVGRAVASGTLLRPASGDFQRDGSPGSPTPRRPLRRSPKSESPG
jgi:hypothetical protein